MKVKKEPTFKDVLLEVVDIERKTPVEVATIGIYSYGRTKDYDAHFLSVSVYKDTGEKKPNFIASFYIWTKYGYSPEEMRKLRDTIGELKKKKGE